MCCSDGSRGCALAAAGAATHKPAKTSSKKTASSSTKVATATATATKVKKRSEDNRSPLRRISSNDSYYARVATDGGRGKATRTGAGVVRNSAIYICKRPRPPAMFMLKTYTYLPVGDPRVTN